MLVLLPTHAWKNPVSPAIDAKQAKKKNRRTSNNYSKTSASCQGGHESSPLVQKKDGLMHVHRCNAPNEHELVTGPDIIQINFAKHHTSATNSIFFPLHDDKHIG